MSIYVGQLNIIQSIGTRYPTLGIFLLEDDNGVLVDALRFEHNHNAEAITRAIFQRWITGTGSKPITWRTLVDVLRECQLAAQADAIDVYFGQFICKYTALCTHKLTMVKYVTISSTVAVTKKYT